MLHRAPLYTVLCVTLSLVLCTDIGFVYTETFSPEFVSQRYQHLTFSPVYTETFPHMHGNVRSVTNRSAMNKMVTRRGKQQKSFDVLAQICFNNAIITYRSHRNVRSVTYRSATKMTTRRGKQQDFFQWSNDEGELLLTLTYEYKVKHSCEYTDWEKVKTKYADILALFREQPQVLIPSKG